MDILALLMLGHQLAVADDGQLIAFFEAVAVRFDKGDFGAVDAFLFDAREKFILRAFMVFDQLIPRRDFLSSPAMYLNGSSAGIVRSKMRRKLSRISAFLAASAPSRPSFSADFSVECRGLVVFAQALQGRVPY